MHKHLHLCIVVLSLLQDVLCLSQTFAELRGVLSRRQLTVIGLKYGTHSITLL